MKYVCTVNGDNGGIWFLCEDFYDRNKRSQHIANKETEQKLKELNLDKPHSTFIVEGEKDNLQIRPWNNLEDTDLSLLRMYRNLFSELCPERVKEVEDEITRISEYRNVPVNFEWDFEEEEED